MSRAKPLTGRARNEQHAMLPRWIAAAEANAARCDREAQEWRDKAAMYRRRLEAIQEGRV